MQGSGADINFIGKLAPGEGLQLPSMLFRVLPRFCSKKALRKHRTLFSFVQLKLQSPVF